MSSKSWLVIRQSSGVARVGDAASEGLRFDQPQAFAFEAVREQPAAATLYDGVDEQPVFVDEIGRYQRVAQRDAAGDHDVLALLLCERTDLRGGVTGENRGVLPVRVGQGRGDDV